jgi:hypothetical protein
MSFSKRKAWKICKKIFLQFVMIICIILFIPIFPDIDFWWYITYVLAINNKFVENIGDVLI